MAEQGQKREREKCPELFEQHTRARRGRGGYNWQLAYVCSPYVSSALVEGGNARKRKGWRIGCRRKQKRAMEFSVKKEEEGERREKKRKQKDKEAEVEVKRRWPEEEKAEDRSRKYGGGKKM